MSAAAVLIIIRPPTAPASSITPQISYEIVGDVLGLDLPEIVEGVADELRAAELRSAG